MLLLQNALIDIYGKKRADADAWVAQFHFSTTTMDAAAAATKAFVVRPPLAVVTTVVDYGLLSWNDQVDGKNATIIGDNGNSSQNASILELTTSDTTGISVGITSSQRSSVTSSKTTIYTKYLRLF